MPHVAVSDAVLVLLAVQRRKHVLVATHINLKLANLGQQCRRLFVRFLRIFDNKLKDMTQANTTRIVGESRCHKVGSTIGHHHGQ